MFFCLKKVIMSRIWGLIREFFFSKANKELFLFIFFLVLSGIFWLITTLNETYEKEFTIPVSIANIPKNAVLTSADTDTIKVTIRDKGFALFSYQFGDVLKKIRPSFRTYSRHNGMGVVPASDLKKLIAQQLSSTSVITAVKPEKLEFYYNYGNKKRVPLRWSGRVIPEELYYISRVDYSPDSVTIYASDEKLDSISMIYTEPLNYANFRDTLVAHCEVAKIKGVKIVPDQVKVTFVTDLLTEERIEGIPIQCLNMPEGKVLRTFPAKVFPYYFIAVAQDCDAAAKRLIRTSPDIRRELTALIGPDTYDAETGEFNKAAVARFLLASEANAQAIDAIVHPAVFRDFEASGLDWLESAIMFESGINRLMDIVIAVVAPKELRIQRVMERDHISREKVLEWMSRQYPQREVIQRADFVLVNDGKANIEHQLNKIIEQCNKQF